jgi:hypothetical protein
MPKFITYQRPQGAKGTVWNNRKTAPLPKSFAPIKGKGPKPAPEATTNIPAHPTSELAVPLPNGKPHADD